jgi:hypothetical protein
MSTQLAEMDHNISFEKANQMIRSFQETKNELQNHLDGKIVLPYSETFNRQAFEQLLNQPDCAGIRMYLSMDELLQLRAVFVAVNKEESDILPTEHSKGVIIEAGKTCPPYCVEASPLNT